MSNTKKITVVHDEAHLEALETTASKIRYLATIYTNGDKVDRGAIAKILNVRYQWVRNVLITPIKK